MELLLFIANVALGAGLLSGPLGLLTSTIDEKKVQAVLAADEPRTAAERYGELFNSLTNDGLKKLQEHSNDTIAIQAAWEEIERSLPRNPDKEVRPDRDKLTRFLGFLEGRGRVRAPRWWAEAILDARANGRGHVHAGAFYEEFGRWFNDPRFNEKDKKAVWPRLETSIEEHEIKTVVRVGRSRAPIPADLPKKLGVHGFFHSVTALITPSRCYLAAHDGFGYPYQLACVDLPSGKLRWITEVRGSFWGDVGGASMQFVEVVEQEDRVVAFGISMGFHVEAFRKDDGVNLFRFSNSYSGQ